MDGSDSNGGLYYRCIHCRYWYWGVVVVITLTIDQSVTFHFRVVKFSLFGRKVLIEHWLDNSEKEPVRHWYKPSDIQHVNADVHITP